MPHRHIGYRANLPILPAWTWPNSTQVFKIWYVYLRFDSFSGTQIVSRVSCSSRLYLGLNVPLAQTNILCKADNRLLVFARVTFSSWYTGQPKLCPRPQFVSRATICGPGHNLCPGHKLCHGKWIEPKWHINTCKISILMNGDYSDLIFLTWWYLFWRTDVRCFTKVLVIWST